MATTITTDTYLDGGTNRTAGDSWLINGAVLTIRTDTRWHSNSPSSMTGSIGSTSISATLGGGVFIDSTAVRWMPYNNGTGNVPAIGTTVTQGSVSGYFLGVWANYTSAPSSVGSVMPATGYLKFREVTGGPFSSGILTGIGASSTASDRQGWIEIVQDQVSANGVPRLGYFKTRGGWFELDQVTSGSPNDIIQIPTNGGGIGTHVPALWIETGLGTNIYEIYPAVLSTWFLAENLSTDIRSKFVQTLGNGQVRIGFDGTANAGFVPPAGCRIRIPSNIGRQCTTTTRNTNEAPNSSLGSRPDFNTTSSGVIDFEYFMNDWYHIFSSPFKVTIKHCATFDIHTSSNNASAMELEDYTTGSHVGPAISLTLTANPIGGTVKNCKFYRGLAANNGHSCSISTCNDIVLTNVEFGIIQYARLTGRAISLLQTINITFNNCFQTNGNTTITTSFGTRINNHDHTDRFKGVTNDITGLYCISVLSSSDDTKVDGVTFGRGGLISNVNPYLAPFYSTSSSNTIFRNAGTRTNPLSVQDGFAPEYICNDGGVNINLKFQRIYLQSNRTSVYFTTNTSKNVTFENCYGTVGSAQTLAVDTLVKGIKTASNSTTGGSSVYGTHTFDLFENDTVGRIWWAMNEPTAFSNAYVTLNLASSVGGFTSAGQVSMQTVGDNIIIETPYYILGHTGFNGDICPIATTVNPRSFKYEYDIDKGTGFSGSYKNLFKLTSKAGGATIGINTISITPITGPSAQIGDLILAPVVGIPVGTTVTNVEGNLITLSSNFTAAVTGDIYFMRELIDEVVSPSTGFKLRIKITTTDSFNTNAITYIRVNTTSTALAQDNLYPLDTSRPTLELTGIETGTTVVVFNADYSKELDRRTITGTTYSYIYDWVSQSGDVNLNVLVWKNNKIPFIANFILGEFSKSVPLSQSDDLVYKSVYTNTHTIDFTNKLIILNSGMYDVQEVYSLWKDKILLTTNAKYNFAFTQIGGNSTGGVNSIPFYTFLSNGWKIRPREIDGTTNVAGGVLLTDDSSDPFVDTLGDYTVRINYQQPIQAIMISVGSGLSTAQDEQLMKTLTVGKFLGLK